MELFKLKNEQVLLSKEILLIPELKAVKETYKEYFNAYAYCHFMTAMKFNPYFNLEEQERSDTLFKSFPGDYDPEDKVMTDAIKYLIRHLVDNDTAIRFWMANKKMIDKLSVYLETTDPNDSKEDGNMNYILKLTKECNDTISNFTKMEHAIEKKLKNRGDRDLSYDLM